MIFSSNREGVLLSFFRGETGLPMYWIKQLATALRSPEVDFDTLLISNPRAY